MPHQLRLLLESKRTPGDLDSGFSHYEENIEPAAIDGDRWLHEHKSYIWKIGVLAVADDNKLDWLKLYIGLHRQEKQPPEYMGVLSFPEGENDDCANTIKRIVDCLAMSFKLGVFMNLDLSYHKEIS